MKIVQTTTSELSLIETLIIGVLAVLLQALIRK